MYRTELLHWCAIYRCDCQEFEKIIIKIFTRNYIPFSSWSLCQRGNIHKNMLKFLMNIFKYFEYLAKINIFLNAQYYIDFFSYISFSVWIGY